MSLCGIPEAELEAPDWLLVEGFALLSVDGVAELDGFALLEDEGAELDDGELWSDWGRVDVLELLVEELPTDELDWLLLGAVLD